MDIKSNVSVNVPVFLPFISFMNTCIYIYFLKKKMELVSAFYNNIYSPTPGQTHVENAANAARFFKKVFDHLVDGVIGLTLRL